MNPPGFVSLLAARGPCKPLAMPYGCLLALAGLTARYRHLMTDLRSMIPHHKKDAKAMGCDFNSLITSLL
jgi:hypothetical protein